MGACAFRLSAGVTAYVCRYQDATGQRLVPCLNPADPNCILPLAGEEPNFNPALPLSIPSNFPSELFYYMLAR